VTDMPGAVEGFDTVQDYSRYNKDYTTYLLFYLTSIK
jgi:hypothetical protein